MPLTRKILSKLLISILSVFFITIIIFYFLILQSFLDIEKENLVTNTQRAQDTLQSIVNNIHVKSTDWSNWDDTYDFVNSNNAKYISSNLVPSSIANINTNVLLIFDSNLKLKADLFVDIKTGEKIPTPPALITYLTKTHPELISINSLDTNYSGIINFNGTPFIISIRPISNSEKTAPPNGVFIFGRYLDEQIIQQIGSQSHNVVNISPYIKNTNFSTQISTTATSINSQHGDVIITDLKNQPAFLLTVIRDRPYYISAIKTLGYFTIIFIFTIAIVVYTNYRIIHTTILTPLSNLIASVDDIFTNKKFTTIIPDYDSMELTSLAKTINSAFSELGISEALQEQKIAAAEKTNKAMINILEDERHLETQIKKQRDEAQTILNSMGEGLLVIDNNFKITAINPVAEQLLETTTQKSLGLLWSELVNTISGSSLTATEERSFSKVLTTGKSIITTLADDHYYLTASGHKFPITSITAPIIHENKIVGAIKVFKDATPEKEEKANIEKLVTKRTWELQEKNKDLENAKRQISDGWLQIQQEKAKLTASLNNLPLGFILCDTGNNILMTNSQVGKLLEIDTTPANLTLMDTEFNMDLTKQNTTCITTHQLIELKDRSFKNHIFRLLISPILVQTPTTQDCIGTAILIEDITEAKVLERSRDEFFSIASHELRTPLTAIRGNTSMILQYFADKLEPDVLTMIHDVEEASVRLIGIVNDFLDVSRLEQGRIEFKKTAFNPIELTKKVINDFASATSQQKIELGLDPACTTSPSVFADEDRTRQVLINLIGNAMKFSEGGKITVSMSTKNNLVEVTITDNGRGIPLENQKLLFRKFQQAGDSLYTRDTSKGTGLGLYVSKLIVEGQGGKIYLVKSAPETGSVFAFTLPILQNS